RRRRLGRVVDLAGEDARVLVAPAADPQGDQTDAGRRPCAELAAARATRRAAVMRQVRQGDPSTLLPPHARHPIAKPIPFCSALLAGLFGDAPGHNAPAPTHLALGDRDPPSLRTKLSSAFPSLKTIFVASASGRALASIWC